MDLAAIASTYAARLRAHQRESREWLDLLSARQLDRYIRDAERELAETPREEFLADVETLLKRGSVDLEVDLNSLDGAGRDELVARLAAVHMEVDQEDLVYARELLEERKRNGLDSIVGEIVQRERRG